MIASSRPASLTIKVIKAAIRHHPDYNATEAAVDYCGYGETVATRPVSGKLEVKFPTFLFPVAYYLTLSFEC